MKSKHNHIKFELPLQWNDETEVTLCREPVGGLTPNIVIRESEVPAGMTLESFARTTIRDAKEAFPGSRLEVVSEARIELDSREMLQRTHLLHIGQGDPAMQIQQVQIHAIQDQHALLVTLTDSVDQFAASMAEALRLTIPSLAWTRGRGDPQLDDPGDK